MGVIMPQVGARSPLSHQGTGGGVADPTLGPLICGTATVVDGSYVWTDYAYDDTAPSAEELGGAAARYPDGAANAADLIQLQLRPTADGLAVRAVLQTLTDP